LERARHTITTTTLITIYVRHSVGCKYEGDEFAKRCDCRKWLRWTPSGGVRQRRKADTRSWTEAEQVKRDLEDQLTGKAVVPEMSGTKDIRAAVKVFVDDKRVQGITADVVAKYKRELGRLASFCEGRGIYTVQGLTRELLTGFATTWESSYPSSQTRSVVRTRCRGFLRYCYEAQWIPRIPALPKITVDEAPTMPLDANEYTRLLDAADKFEGPAPAFHVRALVQLMRWSGLAIRDSLTLPTNRIIHAGTRYRVVTVRQKTGTDVSVVLPPNVAQEILAVAGTKYLFWDGESDIVKSWTKYVIAPLFKAAKIERGGNMMSHRLRDTFAVDLLEKGIPMEDVSKLLGHRSIKTTERSYAKWVKGRQDRLDSLLEGIWAAPTISSAN
jgi:site-specific recombinase XerD